MQRLRPHIMMTLKCALLSLKPWRARGVVEAYREQLEGVVERLRTRLPPAKAAALRHFDSYGLLEVYNSHHNSAHAARRGSGGGLTHAFVGTTAMSQPT